MKQKRLIQAFVLSILLFSFAVTGNAQTGVSGTVVDEGGQPLAGITVMVPNTLIGTQTDTNGKWLLQVDDPQKAVIQFSCLGYQTIEESVGNRAIINVVMYESNEALEEIVHVGYGTQKKVNLTGSVTAVDFDEIVENRTILHTSAALAGLVPGMTVRETSAQPGSSSTSITIRGITSFSGSAPLVLVDGIESSMDYVNPTDIESISVLKDASSTAIYGSRAAGGVILINTKNGSESRPQISYSYNAMFQTPYNNFKWVSNYADYMEYMNEACDNINTSHIFSQTNIDLWREKSADPYGLNEYGMPNYQAYPNTDWFDEIFSTGFTQEHRVSIQGGSRSIRYLVSGSYTDNTGVMTTDGVDSSEKKGQVRVNLEADVAKWFTIGTRFYGQISSLGTGSVSNIFSYLYATTPGVYVGEVGKWGVPACGEENPQANNLLAQACGTSGSKYTYRLSATAYAIFRPYKGLSFEGSFNYSPMFNLQHTYASGLTGRWDYVRNEVYTEPSLDTATVTDYTGRDYRATTDLLARYETTIKGEHALGVLVGYSTIAYEAWSYSVQKKGATDWSLNDGSTYSDLNSASYSPRSGWGMRSYFARVNYGFKDRYLFEANVRIDGSSRFGSATRYGTFPSFSAGWKINEEPWMASASPWLSLLKLRASWGETGKDSGIGNYTWQSTYTSGGVVTDGQQSGALYIEGMSNMNLKWETTSSLDFGIDAAFFKNRLTLEADYYNKRTRDILYTPSTYLTMGDFTQVPSNLGNMWNQGVEISLNWKDNAGDFFYYAGVNFSFNKNKVTNFKGVLVSKWEDGTYVNNYYDVAEDFNDGVLIEGHAIGEHYIKKLYRGTGAGYSGGTVDINAGPKDGMIRTEADMAWAQAMIDAGYTFNGGSTIGKTQLWYGDFIYADLNGDGDYGNTHDKYFTGHSSEPSYNLGVNFGFAWKGLEFSMIWSGAFDYYLIWNADYYNVCYLRTGYGLPSRIANDHYFYDPENPSDSRTNINGKYPRLSTTPINNEVSDFYEYKADYFKLKNVTLAYTIPQKWTRKWFVQQLKFYVSGENLLTITSYPGMDPEIGTSIGYPLMRQYTIGAQITF